ncbi:DUF397 domain-containing protein [Streptomyces sp. NBC_01012]|nr:DUF397 domain-containing protein [Streptomyces sp. NBC_01012]
MRDSKAPHGPALVFSPARWTAFVTRRHGRSRPAIAPILTADGGVPARGWGLRTGIGLKRGAWLSVTPQPRPPGGRKRNGARPPGRTPLAVPLRRASRSPRTPPRKSRRRVRPGRVRKGCTP